MEGNKAEVDNKAKAGDSKAEVVDNKAVVAVDNKAEVAADLKPEAAVSKARDVEVASKANRNEEGNRLKEVVNIKPKEISKCRYHSGPKHNLSPVRQGLTRGPKCQLPVIIE